LAGGHVVSLGRGFVAVKKVSHDKDIGCYKNINIFWAELLDLFLSKKMIGTIQFVQHGSF